MLASLVLPSMDVAAAAQWRNDDTHWALNTVIDMQQGLENPCLTSLHLQVAGCSVFEHGIGKDHLGALLKAHALCHKHQPQSLSPI